jgi:glucosamine-6-phosphate deaminase
MKIIKHETASESGAAAAKAGASLIRSAIQAHGEASIIVATGASQFHMLAALIQEPNIAWNKVTIFHLDEYVGVPITHPASFRRYLWERFQSQLPLPVKAFHYIDAETDPVAECKRMGVLISKVTIDLCFAGIGENGHLAFNDPPADFETLEPYIVVDLDEKCRAQQFGEGWFPTMDDVPKQAVSMSVQQILKSKKIICAIPDERKAEAVRRAVESPVSPAVPSSILQQHAGTSLYLDSAAASKLS